MIIINRAIIISGVLLVLVACARDIAPAPDHYERINDQDKAQLEALIAEIAEREIVR